MPVGSLFFDDDDDEKMDQFIYTITSMYFERQSIGHRSIYWFCVVNSLPTVAAGAGGHGDVLFHAMPMFCVLCLLAEFSPNGRIKPPSRQILTSAQ
jgi:hypothetical protein